MKAASSAASHTTTAATSHVPIPSIVKPSERTSVTTRETSVAMSATAPRAAGAVPPQLHDEKRLQEREDDRKDDNRDDESAGVEAHAVEREGSHDQANGVRGQATSVRKMRRITDGRYKSAVDTALHRVRRADRPSPRRQPRRDRASRVPHLPRARHRDRGGRRPDDTGSLHARSADEVVEISSYLHSDEHIRAARKAGADADPSRLRVPRGERRLRRGGRGRRSDLGRALAGGAPAGWRQARSQARRTRSRRARPSRTGRRTRSAFPCSSRPPQAAAAAACASFATRQTSTRPSRRPSARRRRVRGRDPLLRALPRAAAPRRGAAARGRARERRRARRARLLRPAPASEGARGSSRAPPSTTGCEQPCSRPRSRSGARSATGAQARSSSSSRRAVLLPRAQRPDPGRAPGHGGGHGPRPRREQIRIAGGEALATDRCTSRRGTRSRCGSTPKIRARSFRRRAGSSGSRCQATPCTWRLRRSGRRGGRGGRRGRARLRPDDREAHRPRTRPGRTRSTLLAAALDETEVDGVTTNLPFLRWLVAHPVVRAGEATTAFLDEHPPLSAPPLVRTAAPWRAPWRLNLPAPPPASPPDVDDESHRHGPDAGREHSHRADAGNGDPRRGRGRGRRQARQPLVVLEAMKMEIPVHSPSPGRSRPSTSPRATASRAVRSSSSSTVGRGPARLPGWCDRAAATR